MVKETQVEKQEKSSVKLTITVGKDDVASAYDEMVDKYKKTAQIKGFRKGKAPRDVLERKFGDAFKMEALQELLDGGLRESFESVSEKPLPYSQPELVEEVDIDTTKDLTFSVVYDIFPDIKPDRHTNLSITEDTFSVTKKDEDRELENLQQQNSMVIDKEDETVATDNIVTVDLVELSDDDTPVEGTERKGVSITIGAENDTYSFGDDLIGAKKGEMKTVSQDEKRFQISVGEVKLRDVPELDDEFAQDISDDFETLDDLRKDIKKRLTANGEARIRSNKINQMMDLVVAATDFELPESMIRAELESSWRSRAGQYGATPEQMEQLLSVQGSTKDDLFSTWRGDAEKRLRRTLVIQKLIEEEKIEISVEEAEEHIRTEAQENKSDVDQVLEYYRNNNMLSYVQQELAERRLFDKMLEAAEITKGKKRPYLDLMQDNQ